MCKVLSKIVGVLQFWCRILKSSGARNPLLRSDAKPDDFGETEGTPIIACEWLTVPEDKHSFIFLVQNVLRFWYTQSNKQRETWDNLHHLIPNDFQTTSKLNTLIIQFPINWHPTQSGVEVGFARYGPSGSGLIGCTCHWRILRGSFVGGG